MRLVDKLQLGPFATAYHRAIVDHAFATSLQRFLERSLLPQLDEGFHDADGTLIATFDGERFCGDSSLVRDIFTLDMVLHSDVGASELKADIVFDPKSGSFSPRPGRNHCFYLWTPDRKEKHEREMESIQRLVDDIQRHRPHTPHCPVCGGNILVINDAMTFDVRCRHKHCFKYNYHKDDKGALMHGHFFTTHPAKRV